MFNKICLGCIAGLLALLSFQLTSQSVSAQGSVEYKAVPVDQFVKTETGEVVNGGADAHFNYTQVVLDQYAKNGWELVTASYWKTNVSPAGTLIFRRHR